MKKWIIIILLFFVTGIYTSLSGQDYSDVDYVGVFLEWTATSPASKPDQIRIDPFNNDIVWFTQPSIHGVAKFNFKTKVLTQYDTEGRYRPDGLVIDDAGVLWFGEQSAGTLGKFDPQTEEFEHYKVPYKKANPAIPTVDKDGNIWISDHMNGRMIRFDPKEKSFLAIKAPTRHSWIVDMKADSRNRIWYSCYESNRIGVIDEKREEIIEYVLPNRDSGPAFLAIDSNDHIWFTEWKSNRIGRFDPEKEVFMEYQFPLSNPGPAALAIGSDDIIYFSTKHLNSIVMFDSQDDEYYYTFPIPTAESGQKDGIAVDENGVIWFTEFDKNKFARVTILPTEGFQVPGNSVPNRTIKKVKRMKVYKTVRDYKEQAVHKVTYAKLKN
ncbi:MAG: hypothetical protein IEMM0008_0385 [bacterium]|nr:MAG: hypothetical protein IEMM0008_0385 [bacterium]